MHVTTGEGHSALLTYCANLHPGESLGDVLDGLHRFVAPVRRTLQREAMGIGLWLSRAALTEARADGMARLQEALAAHGLFVFTMNGFPYGDFHAEVVKRRVYHPDLTTDDRRRYLLQLAEALAMLLPEDIAEGTISTLPLAHRDEAGPHTRERACAQLCTLAVDLARLRERTGKHIRVCLEPEPGCLLESTADAISFFAETLPEVARARQADMASVRDHLGVCFDACHQAVAFEDAPHALDALHEAGIVVGKVQLSSALEIPDPSHPDARDALHRFDEPRFLHQVRARSASGEIAGADDLPEARALPSDVPWRIHFHVPIHRELVGAVGTTRPFLREALARLRQRAVLPHLEVETYTWSVLPAEERPRNDAQLIAGVTRELRWVMEELS